MKYSMIVVGAGHAGCEAALAAARLGIDTLLLTLNMDAIALMACNPVIGGTAKGHLVREIDALGGEMGKAIDDTFLQSRMLNRGKGPAVYSLRAQADKKAYQNRMRQALFSQERLTVREGEVAKILVENRKVVGVTTTTGMTLYCQKLVLACGVYLKSRIIIGEKNWEGGPQGLMAATQLSENLIDLGFPLMRFKTGTPARVDERSIDFEKMEIQPGDEPIVPFSFLTEKKLENTMACYLTWTNERTHEVIQKNLYRAPMYSGDIKGTGARYCPSIEDKVVRFADKNRHQIFLEPEGAQSKEWYAQGMSSSMPEEVQWEMYRTIRGLERCELTRLAYAIEYDCIDSKQLKPTLESLDISGLYFAGQINGTSGYEEAAAQGLVAGVNGVLAIQNKEPLVLTRDMAYIGVLIDDLTTKGTDEPYRMMTSRAEYRLTLRQDNADLRLTAIGYKVGLAQEKRMKLLEKKLYQTEKGIEMIRSTMVPISEKRDELLSAMGEKAPASPMAAENLLKRPGFTFSHLEKLLPELQELSPQAKEQVEIEIKYEGYLKKQDAQIQKTKALEKKLLPEGIDYQQIAALRIEARQKLSAQRPRSLGQAGRIPGVSPADIAVLMVWLEKNKEK
ncbi:MAG: tRNA uridine-5-carboxymethylaminomethyl(34) synthesis enzyme MnmG [Clostridiales bacterium]|nr:tRNA uridine-5-carboxymethylaminomethyl(34) synthesis enzyme MnmG [Clostridiales bacterium]